MITSSRNTRRASARICGWAVEARGSGADEIAPVFLPSWWSPCGRQLPAVRPEAGCAAHPLDKPGAIASASFANEWTLAHQIGHVLGLDHVDGVNRLMTRRSTGTIEAAVPEIVESEVATMMDSPFNKI